MKLKIPPKHVMLRKILKDNIYIGNLGCSCNAKNSQVRGSGDLSKKSNVKMSKE